MQTLCGIFDHGGGENVSSSTKDCDFDTNSAEGNGGAMHSLGASSGQANHMIVNSRFTLILVLLPEEYIITEVIMEISVLPLTG